MDSRLKRGRGRPKKLDRNQVLDFVMISYWNDGPTNVSINDICKNSGISKPSLYNEFGNEDELQAAALHNYHEKILSQLFKIFDETIPFNHSLKKLIDFNSDTFLTKFRVLSLFQKNSASLNLASTTLSFPSLINPF